MRATTITNWDRQEFVVPNKSLITDTILNWTLKRLGKSDRHYCRCCLRYRSDKAVKFLKVSNDHPVIMNDPGPLATFEQFADSTLNLVLRCYVRFGFRLRTTSELTPRFIVHSMKLASRLRFHSKTFTFAGIEHLTHSNGDKKRQRLYPRSTLVHHLGRYPSSH